MVKEKRIDGASIVMSGIVVMKKVLSLSLKDNKMKISKILIKAKQIIQSPDNWCKHTWHQFNGDKWQHCTLGAIAFAFDNSIISIARNYSVSQCFIKANSLPTDVGIGVWNDRESTKHSDVMQAFDKAIAYAQVREETPITEHSLAVQNLVVEFELS